MKNNHENFNTINNEKEYYLERDQSIKHEKSSNNKKKILISNKVIANTFNKEFIPLVLATTFFAPINRIKICLQNMTLMSINESEKVYRTSHLIQKIVKDQGFISLWRGNLSNIYKNFFICYSNLFIYHRIKLYLETKKDKINLPNFINRFISVSLSSFISLLFYYPLELANARICGDMTRYGHKKLFSSVTDVFTKTLEDESLSRGGFFGNLGISKFYRGFSINLISNTLYWTIVISSFDTFKNYFEIKRNRVGEDLSFYSFIPKMTILFGATGFCSIIASMIVYPLDTLKRNLQVTGSLGYKSEFSGGNHLAVLKDFTQLGVTHMYRGFGINLIKTISYPFVLFTLIPRDKKEENEN